MRFRPEALSRIRQLRLCGQDYLTVKSNAATTLYKAVGTTGAEIEALYTKNSDGTMGDKLEQDATTSAGKFAYTPDTKALTFTGIDDGTEIVVFYKRKITADVLENNSEHYSGKCALYVDALGEDKCAMYIVFSSISRRLTSMVNLVLKSERTRQYMHSTQRHLQVRAETRRSSVTYTIFGADTEDAN